MTILPAWILEMDLSAQHLLLCEADVDRWWRIHQDGTRTLVGSFRDAEALALTWTAWSDPPQVSSPGFWHQSPAEYVGERYAVAHVDAALLEHWPDASPGKEIR